jgi:OmpA-OmpF porin, OOP family
MTIRTIAITLFLLFCTSVHAQTATTTANDESGKVIAAGTVPDEASRAAILGKLRDVYGTSAVVDRLEIGGVVPPPNWNEHMAKILNANLKQVHKGQLQVNGTQITLKGNVANEAQRQQVISDMATALNPTYTIDNGLVVASAAPAQTLLDSTLSNRVVEFESGSATLTPAGNAILDEMFAAIKQIGSSKIQIIGHTDSSGSRQANIALSLARANSVRAYLVGKGIPAGTLSTVGAGPDRPLAANDTSEGRSKNRRIEFHLVN